MKPKMICGVYAFVISGVWGGPTTWGNSAPVVSNVTVSQRRDASKLVDIHYDLADADDDACTVSVQVSNDAGATWTVPVTALTGAVGSGVTPGVGKLIAWDCRADLPGVFGSQYKVKVCADDGHTAVPPGMALIPAGEFQMGDTFYEGYSDEGPVHAVHVDAFYMDTCEVTNEQYKDALNWAYGLGGLITVTSGAVYKAGSGTSYPYCDTTTSDSYSRITWDGSMFGVTSGKENHPMVCVSWYGAVAYANWRSGMQGKPLCYDPSSWECNWGSGHRLPTEAEWEKAARGGTTGHRFPWSDSDYIQHARANYYSSSYYPYDTSPTRGYHPAFNTGVYPYTSPVGYFAPNGYGLYDMVGNASEWCNDRYSETYYSTTPYPHNNPHGPTTGSYRVLRGASWIDRAYYSRCAIRYDYYTPGNRDVIYGFRLALNAENGVCGESALFPIENREAAADLDGDGDVDGFDFLTFTNCYNGSDKIPLVACENPAADMEGDGDVDGFDFLTFANCYNGSDRPPRCP